ncbi:hypothetical protein [Pseudomonas sp. HLT2-19-2]
MFFHRWSYTLLGSLLPQLCMASTLPINPQSESLYQQAVPYLQEANNKLEALPVEFPTANEDEKKRLLARAEEAGALLKPAITLLEQAAALDHPVAQYRLGLIYVMLYPSKVIEEKACPLFEQSLAHGFAPPALGIASWCLAFTNTPQYQTALQSTEARMPIYEKYFPQPAVKLECRQEQPAGMAMQWGSIRDYQAEIYRLLGDGNRTQRREYYQKAIDINECYKANKRMKFLKQSDA